MRKGKRREELVPVDHDAVKGEPLGPSLVGSNLNAEYSALFAKLEQIGREIRQKSEPQHIPMMHSAAVVATSLLPGVERKCSIGGKIALNLMGTFCEHVRVPLQGAIISHYTHTAFTNAGLMTGTGGQGNTSGGTLTELMALIDAKILIYNDVEKTMKNQDVLNAIGLLWGTLPATEKDAKVAALTTQMKDSFDFLRNRSIAVDATNFQVLSMYINTAHDYMKEIAGKQSRFFNTIGEIAGVVMHARKFYRSLVSGAASPDALLAMSPLGPVACLATWHTDIDTSQLVAVFRASTAVDMYMAKMNQPVPVAIELPHKTAHSGRLHISDTLLNITPSEVLWLLQRIEDLWNENVLHVTTAEEYMAANALGLTDVPVRATIAGIAGDRQSELNELLTDMISSKVIELMLKRAVRKSTAQLLSAYQTAEVRFRIHGSIAQLIPTAVAYGYVLDAISEIFAVFYGAINSPDVHFPYPTYVEKAVGYLNERMQAALEQRVELIGGQQFSLLTSPASLYGSQPPAALKGEPLFFSEGATKKVLGMEAPYFDLGSGYNWAFLNTPFDGYRPQELVDGGLAPNAALYITRSAHGKLVQLADTDDNRACRQFLRISSAAGFAYEFKELGTLLFKEDMRDQAMAQLLAAEASWVHLTYPQDILRILKVNIKYDPEMLSEIYLLHFSPDAVGAQGSPGTLQLDVRTRLRVPQVPEDLLIVEIPNLYVDVVTVQAGKSRLEYGYHWPVSMGAWLPTTDDYSELLQTLMKANIQAYQNKAKKNFDIDNPLAKLQSLLEEFDENNQIA